MGNGKKEFPVYTDMSAELRYVDLLQEEIELRGEGLTIHTVNNVEETPQKQVSDYYPSGKAKTDCKFCVNDGVFEHDGFDPTHKKGIWKKGKRKICIKKLSMQAQNNKGVWYICDKARMHECHFYEQE